MEASAAVVAAADKMEPKVALDRRPFVDRYYVKKYFLNSESEGGGDYMILLHSNKLAVLTLAPSHPIIKQNLTVISINFKISTEVNRNENIVSGKRKKGGQMLGPKSPICNIECSCGKSFVVRAGLGAKLLEVNDRIGLEPELLKKVGTGYLAILSSRVSDFESQMKSLLTEEEYLQKLNERL